MLKTKKEILEQLSFRHLWNKTAVINGIKVARVAWHTDRAWKVIEHNAEFDDITSYEYKPIAQFYYQSELADYILNNSVKKV